MVGTIYNQAGNEWTEQRGSCFLKRKIDSGGSTDSVYSTEVVGRRKSEQYEKYEGEQQMRLIGKEA